MSVKQLFDLDRQGGAGHRRIARPGPADGRGAGRDGRQGRADGAQARRARRGRRAAANAAGHRCRGLGLRPVETGRDRARSSSGRSPRSDRSTCWSTTPERPGARPTIDHPLEAWQKVVDLNLTAMFVVSQEVGRRSMLPRRQRQDHQHRIDTGARRRRRPGTAGRPSAYNTTQGWRGQLHPLARRRMGAVQHQRQRDRARLLSDQDDQGHPGDDGRRRWRTRRR